MENKEAIKISEKTIGANLIGILGSLFLGRRLQKSYGPILRVMSDVQDVMQIEMKKRVRITGSFNIKEAAHCFLFYAYNYKGL